MYMLYAIYLWKDENLMTVNTCIHAEVPGRSGVGLHSHKWWYRSHLQCENNASVNKMRGSTPRNNFPFYSNFTLTMNLSW